MTMSRASEAETVMATMARSRSAMHRRVPDAIENLPSHPDSAGHVVSHVGATYRGPSVAHVRFEKVSRVLPRGITLDSMCGFWASSTLVKPGVCNDL
jgi:hypothetical protein